jgi:hypothetical protein
MELGLLNGLKALCFRVRQCRGGYKLFRTPEGGMSIILADGTILNSADASVDLIKPAKKR